MKTITAGINSWKTTIVGAALAGLLIVQDPDGSSTSAYFVRARVLKDTYGNQWHKPHEYPAAVQWFFRRVC